MACTGTNWKRRKDIDYMIFMATIFGKGIAKTIGIYEENKRAVGKIFNFEEVVEGKKYIKVIRFNKNATRKAVLRDNVGGKRESTDNIGNDNTSTSFRRVDGDSGGILQEKQSTTVPKRSKKSNKSRKSEKRD